LCVATFDLLRRFFHNLLEVIKNLTLQKTRTLRPLKLCFLQIIVSHLLHLILHHLPPLLLLFQHMYHRLYFFHLQLYHVTPAQLLPSRQLDIWTVIIQAGHFEALHEGRFVARWRALAIEAWAFQRHD
jgi:hypothetical protein